MANTLIQLKHSTVTNIPPSLNTAEPAYSYTSNTLFIGLEGAVINIGGQFYTSQIDDATDEATGGTLVRRDATGNVSFNFVNATNISAEIDGNANSATQLQTPRFFNFTGDVDAVSVSFDGTANADFTLELANTGVVADTYGGTTQIPVITIDEDGRVTNAVNVSVATDLSIAADTGSNTISLLSDTLTFVGGDGITTSIGPTDNVEFAVDNTVIRTTGNQSITGDFTLNGNLIVQGNTVSYNVVSYQVNDPLILLANNNTGNSVDLGFVAHYVDNAETKHTGLVRNVATSTWYLFENYGPHIQEDHVLNIADPTLVTSNLYANLIGGRVYDLASAIEVSDGGTGQTSFTTGSIIIGNGTSGLLELANTTSAGTYGNAAFVPVITVDNYGRVSNVTVQEIKISMDDLDGILPIVNGGTGANTFTTNGVLLGQGTSAITTASSSTEGHVLTINASGVPEFSMLSGGTF
jgi:hypothetical protein